MSITMFLPWIVGVTCCVLYVLPCKSNGLFMSNLQDTGAEVGKSVSCIVTVFPAGFIAIDVIARSCGGLYPSGYSGIACSGGIPARNLL